MSRWIFRACSASRAAPEGVRTRQGEIGERAQGEALQQAEGAFAGDL
ncbi:hypothetical protein [Nonomuraea helvata]